MANIPASYETRRAEIVGKLSQSNCTFQYAVDIRAYSGPPDRENTERKKLVQNLPNRISLCSGVPINNMKPRLLVKK